MSGVDLLVFGPHPDDLEIGLGGTIAHHAALGLKVALCDLTAGEMGSNGTVESRLAESEKARDVLGAVSRDNLRWPDRRIGKDPNHLEEAVAFIRRHRPRVMAAPYWTDRHPDHVAASQVLTEAAFNAGLRRYRAEGEAWKPKRQVLSSRGGGRLPNGTTADRSTAGSPGWRGGSTRPTRATPTTSCCRATVAWCARPPACSAWSAR